MLHDLYAALEWLRSIVADRDPLTITLLGTGTSHGIPMIACDCPVCTSDDPRDQRMRASARIEFDGHSVLIDTGPEFRLQCLTHDVRRCDAVLYTHHHMDHIAGLDDLRRFNWLQDAEIPCYGQPATLERIRRVFPYVEPGSEPYPSARPKLLFRELTGPFELLGRTCTPIPLMHGALPVLGYRIGDFAYCTDVSHIPDDSWSLLDGLEVLVLDALRRRPHATHFNLEQAVAAAARIGAGQTLFTHIAHELGHVATNAELPPRMALAFDGQRVSCS